LSPMMVIEAVLDSRLDCPKQLGGKSLALWVAKRRYA